MKKIIIILLGIFLFTSCLKDEVPFQYIIRVSVTDYEGTRIEGADVTLKFLKNGKNDYPYTYNKLEECYEFANLTDIGEYQIWVDKKGNIYKNGQGGAILKENKIESVSIKLEKF
jgi:hypothetical protein